MAGASAVQLGTANFAEPVACLRILDALPAACHELGAASLADVVGTLVLPTRQPCVASPETTPDAR